MTKKVFQISREEQNGKGDRKCFRCGDPNHLIGECPKPPKDKNQRAFVGGSWSDSGEEDDEKVKDEMCLVAHASSEVCSESSYFSDENSSIDDIALDNEYDKLCKMSPRPKHIIVNKVKVLVASDNEVKQFYKLLSKPGVGFSKLNFRSKTPPPRRVNDNYSRPKTPQPKRHVGRQNQPHGFPICLGVDLEPDEWIKDSGCSKHMTGNRKLFSTYKAYNGGNVIFGSNLRGNIIGKGQICDNKCRVTFSEHDSEITKDGKVIGRGIRKKGLYVMKLGNKPKDQICLTTIDENSTLWHRRLGHANMRLIQSLASKELVRNLPKLKFDQHFCDACKIGKQAHASHKAKNVVSTTRCLELLHMDLFGPSAVRSYGGNRYTLVIVDDYSRYTWTRFLKDKTEAFDQFEIFSRKIQNQLGCSIVSIRTDHGREFDNEVQFGEFCNTNGITHNFSAPRTPQSNGVVERKNRTLQEMSRTMLNEQSLPQKFWCNAVDTSTYILNRILIRAILGKTPYELLRGRKPTLDYFRVFGSKCFILNTKDYLTKFDPKSYEGVFLANRIFPDPDRTWVDEILRFMEPVGYRPTMLLLRHSDRKESDYNENLEYGDRGMSITSYGYGLKIVSSGWSFGASFTQRTIPSISIGGSITSEGFLSSILLLVVIIVTVVVIVILIVVVVDDVSLILKLSFVIIGVPVSWCYCWDGRDLVLAAACAFQDGSNTCNQLTDQHSPSIVGVEDVEYNVVEEEDGEWIYFLGGNSSSGTKKYRGSNSSDGGNTGDGVKIAGEVIGSGGEIVSKSYKKLLPVEAGI
ncbi:retrovirus-related pol polyprotein from transposon TNT 1-94 [Tanacetum coccineum]